MRGDCPDDVVGVCGDFGGHDDLHALDQCAGEHARVVEFWGGILPRLLVCWSVAAEPVWLEFVRLDDDHVVGVAEEHVGHQEGFRPGDVEFWLAGPFHRCGCRLALHPQHSRNRSNAGVGEVHAPPPGGGQHVDDSHRPGHVPDALPAPGFPRLPRRRFARAAAVIARRASLWMNPHTSGTLWVIMVRPSMVLPNAFRMELKDFPSAISSRDNPCMCLGPGSSGTDNTAWKSESGSPEAVNTTASMTTSCAVDG